VNLPLRKTTKRIFDLLVGIPLALAFLPLIIIIGLVIKLYSGEPVIYSHKRIGKSGDLFTCYKFRSMYKDADERLKDYLERNPDAKEEWDKYKKLKSFDPRVTRMGKIIRKFCLDELPQIFNVLKGDMSIVGPRPYLPRERGEVGDYLDDIVSMKPGMTSYWVVNGWNGLEFKERHKLEAWYVENRNLWIDIKILLKTVFVVLTDNTSDG